MKAASRERILKALSDRDDQSLTELAQAAGVRAPTALRHLMLLADQGWVERFGDHQEVRYRIKNHVAIRWSVRMHDPAGVRRAAHREWAADVSVDWRFPLVSAVPDGPARDTLNRFLAICWRQHRLTPWSAPDETFEGNRAWESMTADQRARLRSEEAHGTFSLVVYGSCARGDARVGSDLDIAVIRWPQKGPSLTALYNDLYEEVAFRMAPGATRPVQILSVTRDDLIEGGRMGHIAPSVVAEGITVYTSDGAQMIELEKGGGRESGATLR